jgi:addiction module RelE/StbE family toxin
MWTLEENLRLERKWRKFPKQVLHKYELWKSIVRYNGPQKLREFPGFHDEALKGEWQGYRSSRLNIQYRVVYSVNSQEEQIRVEDMIPHTY